MMSDNLGLSRLEYLDPRTIWKNEAGDLTPWLLENLDALAQALDTEIIPEQREVRVGDFAVDVLGSDSSGQPVIVENQLEPTDHGHLGQLIVYASGLEAAVVIWLTPRFRDEHRRALDWLNERTDENVNFFGVELDVVRINSSPAAPMFRVVAQPNDWQKSIKKESRVSDTARARHDFFSEVMPELGQLRPSFRQPSIGFDNWISMASGPFGYFALSFASGNRLRVELYLDTGDKTTTKQIFDELMKERAGIEAEIGAPLSWERLDERRASRIAVYMDAPDLNDALAYSQAREWAAKYLARFMEVLDPLARKYASRFR